MATCKLTFLLMTSTAMLYPQSPSTPIKGPWMDASLSPDRRAELVLARMTLDEKLQTVHGVGMIGRTQDPASLAALERSNGGAGFVPGIPRLGIPDLNMADSAMGVAKGDRRSRYSTPLPNNLALAASWDLNLAHEYGALIGRELRDQGYNHSLGGGVNLMRDPRNGRNFEYLGEDPILAGKLVAQLIRGIQSQKVMGDIKHFALNDQETGRHIADVRADRRTMRETDLLAFEIGIREGNPSSVMCSYNRVNGEYACENHYLLTDLLKKTWAFPGFVVSDWYANYATAKSAIAGLDMEQPGPGYFGTELREAIRKGEVPPARLDDMVRRILRSEFAAGIVDDPPVQRVVDVFKGLELAQRVAEESVVLLKNASGALPLNAQAIKSIAVIGIHADKGVLSGGGSAQVDPPGGNAVSEPPPLPPPGESGTEAESIWGNHWVWYPSSPLKAIRERAPGAKVTFDGGSNPASAAAAARSADVAVVFVVQPTSEGRDTTLTLPWNQDALIQAVARANPRTIVVLENGNPVKMPWLEQVPAILESWYPGIRGAEATARILFGDVNPSGKLPATFPRSESDLPRAAIVPAPPGRLPQGSFGNGGRPGMPRIEPFEINYTEGLKVGYKWFDAEKREPLFAFGHGLSYTTFSYSDLNAKVDEVRVTVRNTGSRPGAEIVQVYAGLPAAAAEPPKRLVAWEKVRLGNGESKTVVLKVDRQFLSVFHPDKDAWELTPGEYTFYAGGSSRTTALTQKIAIR